MTDILTSISTYDSDSHIPYPTLEYIKDETGEDLSQEDDTTEDAFRRVKHLTKTAKHFLMHDKILDTQKKLEYLIATNEDYRRAFLEYVASFIFDVVMVGGNVLQTVQGDLNNVLTAKTKAFMKSKLLSAYHFTYIDYDYHVGY